MKLYNILDDIILEERKLLTEGSKEDISSAIDNHTRVRIYYQGDKETGPGVRVIDTYAYGVSKGGNEVIRAFQPFGVSTSEMPGWRLFRVDRISRWEPMNFKFTDKAIKSDPSIPNPNPSGDRSMARVYKVARFGLGDEEGDVTADKYTDNEKGFGDEPTQYDNKQGFANTKSRYDD
jgi:hypothetical protein